VQALSRSRLASGTDDCLEQPVGVSQEEEVLVLVLVLV